MTTIAKEAAVVAATMMVMTCRCHNADDNVNTDVDANDNASGDADDSADADVAAIDCVGTGCPCQPVGQSASRPGSGQSARRPGGADTSRNSPKFKVAKLAGRSTLNIVLTLAEFVNCRVGGQAARRPGGQLPAGLDRRQMTAVRASSSRLNGYLASSSRLKALNT